MIDELFWEECLNDLFKGKHLSKALTCMKYIEVFSPQIYKFLVEKNIYIYNFCYELFKFKIKNVKITRNTYNWVKYFYIL